MPPLVGPLQTQTLPIDLGFPSTVAPLKKVETMEFNKLPLLFRLKNDTNVRFSILRGRLVIFKTLDSDFR